MFPVTVFAATVTLSPCSEMLLVNCSTTRISFTHVVTSDDLGQRQELYHPLQHHIPPVSLSVKVLFREVRIYKQKWEDGLSCWEKKSVKYSPSYLAIRNSDTHAERGRGNFSFFFFGFQTTQNNINPLNTKRRLLYLKTQFVPCSKHFSSRL